MSSGTTSTTTTTVPKMSKIESKPTASATSRDASFIVAQVFTASIIYLVLKASTGFRDITDALAFYGVYHANPWNQFIHFFGVPGIIYSGLIFLAHLPLPGLKSTFLTWNLVLSAFYFSFYLYIDPFGGVLYSPVVYAMYASSKHFYDTDQQQAQKAVQLAGNKKNDDNIAPSASSTTIPWYGTGKVLKYAFALHILSWYVQVHIGHQIVEGAKPALMQSLGGAITVAPLFAFYEGLWFVGINRALQNQTLALVGQYTEDMCRSGEIAIRACAQYA